MFWFILNARLDSNFCGNKFSFCDAGQKRTQLFPLWIAKWWLGASTFCRSSPPGICGAHCVFAANKARVWKERHGAVHRVPEYATVYSVPLHAWFVWNVYLLVLFRSRIPFFALMQRTRVWDNMLSKYKKYFFPAKETCLVLSLQWEFLSDERKLFAPICLEKILSLWNLWNYIFRHMCTPDRNG